MTKKKIAKPWKNRIVSYGVKPANQFTGHPDNWRIHPNSQERLLIELFEKIGWIDDVIESKRSGYMIDGHLRVKAALGKDEHEPVPFKVVDVTEAEETVLLAVYDPMASLAGTDKIKLAELIQLVPESLSTLTKALHSERETARKLVAFSAEKHFRVIVECQNEIQQQELITRLHNEGYSCRTTDNE